MSRVDDEFIMAIVRNRSGMDAGEIDWIISSLKFDRQQVPCLKDIIKNLDYLRNRCSERINELLTCDHDWVIEDDQYQIKTYRCTKCHGMKYD
jgi:hypothetical protein